MRHLIRPISYEKEVKLLKICKKTCVCIFVKYTGYKRRVVTVVNEDI